MLPFDNRFGNGKAETGALADRLRRIERRIKVRLDFLGNTRAVVFDDGGIVRL